MTTAKFFQDLDLANIDTLVTDCDDTLYPGNLKQYPRDTEAALHGRIKQNIKAVVDNDPEMLRVLGVESLDISTLGDSFPKIIKHFQQKGEARLNEVLGRFYDVEYNFNPNHVLASGLQELKTIGIRLAVDTNGPAFNLEKVLERHGIEANFFDGQVLDILTAKHGKPTAERAAEVVKRFGITDPARAVYLDDSPDVLRKMKEAGFKTIWINDTGKKLTDEQRAFIDAEYANPGDFVQEMASAHRALEIKQTQRKIPERKFG